MNCRFDPSLDVPAEACRALIGDVSFQGMERRLHCEAVESA
jgi:hypothetical protein